MLTLKPITRVFLQFDGGYYSLPFNALLGLVILPGTGAGLLTQGPTSYAIPAADPAASASPVTVTAEELDALLASVLSPTTTIITPADDLSKAIVGAGATGVVSLAPGHYAGAYDFVVPDDSA